MCILSSSYVFFLDPISSLFLVFFFPASFWIYKALFISSHFLAIIFCSYSLLTAYYDFLWYCCSKYVGRFWNIILFTIPPYLGPYCNIWVINFIIDCYFCFKQSILLKGILKVVFYIFILILRIFSLGIECSECSFFFHLFKNASLLPSGSHFSDKKSLVFLWSFFPYECKIVFSLSLISSHITMMDPKDVCVCIYWGVGRSIFLKHNENQAWKCPE